MASHLHPELGVTALAVVLLICAAAGALRLFNPRVARSDPAWLAAVVSDHVPLLPLQLFYGVSAAGIGLSLLHAPGESYTAFLAVPAAVLAMAVELGARGLGALPMEQRRRSGLSLTPGKSVLRTVMAVVAILHGGEHSTFNFVVEGFVGAFLMVSAGVYFAKGVLVMGERSL